MTRQEALGHIEALYGFEHESVRETLGELAERALTDEALISIAQKQLEIENRKAALCQRVTRYQDRHPFMSWRECERHVKTGL